MTGVKSDSISEKTTERSVLRFFSPLIATMYTKDDWGNLEEYGEEVFPAELCSYETEILKRIAEENLEEEGDRGLAVYLDDPKLEEKIYSNTDGQCYPAIGTIAKELNLSRRTVERAIQDLVKAGLIKKEQRWRENGGKSSLLYTLIDSS